MSEKTRRRVHPMFWVPSLYFAESVPNAIVSDTANFMYTDFGLTPDKLGVVTGLMYWAWVVKPLWSPLVDLVKTKRWWIVLTELALAFSFLGLAVSIRSPDWLLWTQVCLWVMAFASATQDIAADGFYMLGLNEREQAGYSGVRSTAYKLAMWVAKGILIWAVARLTLTMTPFVAWSSAMLIPGVAFVILAIYHLIVLPRPPADVALPARSAGDFFEGYINTFATFFVKPKIGQAIAFMLLFRLAEVQVLAMVAPFLKGKQVDGGLEMAAEQVGVAYGTFGFWGIVFGGLMAGAIIAKSGLKRWFWVLIVVMHVPNLAFLFLAYTQINTLPVVSTCLFIEQFGYGFGFTVYVLFLIYYARGEQQTAHYAIATGFMAASVMIPKLFCGFVQKALGFKLFFVYVTLCTLPSFFVSWLAWRDKDFLAYFEVKPKGEPGGPENLGLSPESSTTEISDD